jgi:hypothetical protein
MIADLPFWHKIWNRGVDIAAGVTTNTISAGIVALIATWTWRWKRGRDLKYEEDKQRQQHAIAEELAEKRRLKENLSRVSRLQRELEALVEKFANAGSPGNAEQLQKAWDTWAAWLEKNELNYLPANRKILNRWALYSDNFRYAGSQQNASQWAGELITELRGTQLSPD